MTMLRDDSHRTGTSESPLCESCNVNDTAEHFLLHCSLYDPARSHMRDYLKDTGIYAKLKGKILESSLLASTCDNDSISKKDKKILKEALFQFLHQVNRMI